MNHNGIHILVIDHITNINLLNHNGMNHNPSH